MLMTRGPRPPAGSTFWLVVTWVALDGAVATYLLVNGVNAVSTSLLVLAAAAFGLAVVTEPRAAPGVQTMLLIVVGAQMVLRVLVPFRPELPSPAWLFPALALGAGVLYGVVIVTIRRAGTQRAVQACLLGIVALGLACRAAIVLADVHPTFDVPRIQEAAAAALRAGSDPYLTHVYDSGYPYLPVAAIGAAIASLFGDARWAIVAGDAMTIVGILVLAHRLRAPAPLGPTVAALWAWWAGGLYVVWQGFPEPLLLGFLTLGVAALVGPQRHELAAGVLVGLSVATKQFGVAVLPFLLLSRHGRKVAVIAVVTAVVIVAPFGLWHTREFLEGTFWSQLAEPGRDYSLNLLVWPSVRLDPPYVPILVVAMVAGWWVSRRYERVDADAGWVAGSTTLLLIAFLANRIAFVNYYSLVMLLLLLLVTLLSARLAPTSSAVAPA